MADIDEKTPLNVPGKFYVDSSCLDCDLCRETAPENFGRDEDEGVSYVKKPARTMKPNWKPAWKPWKAALWKPSATTANNHLLATLQRPGL